jgi:hypothetical protein
VLSAAIGVASPALAQLTPSPDPDPQVGPDPVTTQSHSSPAQGPAVHTPVVRSAPQPVTAPASRPSPTQVVGDAKPARQARHASKPHPARKRTTRHAVLEARRRLTVPSFPPLVAVRADDRSQARELSFAAIALLLVVIAGGSLLRMTREVHRGRPA